jgi:hypothetical protein
VLLDGKRASAIVQRKFATKIDFRKPSQHRLTGLVLLLVVAAFAGAGHGAALADGAQSTAVAASYHAGPDRSGNYVVPGLSWQAAVQMHRDKVFSGAVSGQIYAQPLYWRPWGAAHGMVIVATENNIVYGLDAATGRAVWLRGLGRPTPRALLPCGNIDPVGVTGTPVIDLASGTLYLDAMIDEEGVPRHLIFALRLRDGAVLPGWPVGVETELFARGVAFSSRLQNQRGALALGAGRLYLPFGGHFGDCDDYRGLVVGVHIAPPRIFGAWVTRALGGGIWAPGGVVSDGRDLFVATGTTDAPPISTIRPVLGIFSLRQTGAHSTWHTPSSAAQIRCRSICRRRHR